LFYVSAEEGLLHRLVFKKLTRTNPRCDAVCWETALQAGRSRVRIPIVSLEFWPHYGSGDSEM